MSIGGLQYRLNALQKSAAILTFAGGLQLIHHYYYHLFLIQSLFRLSAFNLFYLIPSYNRKTDVCQDRASGVSFSFTGVDCRVIYERLAAAGRWSICSSSCALESKLLLGKNRGVDMYMSNICENTYQKGTSGSQPHGACVSRRTGTIAPKVLNELFSLIESWSF